MAKATAILQRGRAFTLIEVLAAIAVLVITLPALMQAYTLCGDVAAVARQRAEAVGIAQTVLDEQMATQDYLVGTASGEEKPGPTPFKWVTDITDWEEDNTQQLTITVTWSRKGNDYSVVLDTLVYVPDATIGSTTVGGLP